MNGSQVDVNVVNDPCCAGAQVIQLRVFNGECNEADLSVEEAETLIGELQACVAGLMPEPALLLSDQHAALTTVRELVSEVARALHRSGQRGMRSRLVEALGIIHKLREPLPSSEPTTSGIEQAFDTLEVQLDEVWLTSPDFYKEAAVLKERFRNTVGDASREHIVVAALMLQRDMAKQQMESEAK